MGFVNVATSQFRIVGPILDAVSPDGGVVGSTVTLSGEGFGTTSNTKVYFSSGTGRAAATISTISANSIQVTVPVGAIDGSVHAEVSGVPSNVLPFDIRLTLAGGSSFAGGYLAIDNQDRIYFTDGSASNVINRINQDGDGKVAVYVTTEQITGIVAAPAGDSLYFVTRGEPEYQGTLFRYGTGRIYELSLTGTATLKRTLPLPVYADAAGIDVVPPLAWVGATVPEAEEVLLQVNLQSGAIDELFQLPFSDLLWSDVNHHTDGTIYSSYFPPGGSIGWHLMHNTTDVYANGDVGAIDIDCLGRVRFTDVNNQRVLRYVSPGNATLVGPTRPFPMGVGLDSSGNIMVSTSDGIQRLSTAGAGVPSCSKNFLVEVSGDSARAWADYDPVQDLVTPNAQFVVLEACLGEPTLPRDSTDYVAWTHTDVDDPATDSGLDPNGATGNDNMGVLDGVAPFTQEGTYTLHEVAGEYRSAYGPNGCSKVRFRPTDAPGDNFEITVNATTRVGSNVAKTEIMTVWKRLHMEVDSMGEVVGPLDSDGDDALIGDVPDPDVAFAEGILAPAYIAVVPETSFDTGNVQFDAHLPDSSLASEEDQHAQYVTQGNRGRGSLSSTGTWWTYIQAAYEGDIEEDLDSDAKALLGVNSGLSGKWGFQFTETIRDAMQFAARDEAYGKRFNYVHEMGHQFGLDHPLNPDLVPSNLMQEPDFDANGFLTLGEPYVLPSDLRILRCSQPLPSGCRHPSRLP